MMGAMTRRTLFALLLLTAPAWSQPGVNQPQPKLTEEPLVIITRDGTRHDFRVEMAIEPSHQMIGLMFTVLGGAFVIMRYAAH